MRRFQALCGLGIVCSMGLMGCGQASPAAPALSDDRQPAPSDQAAYSVQQFYYGMPSTSYSMPRTMRGPRMIPTGRMPFGGFVPGPRTGFVRGIPVPINVPPRRPMGPYMPMTPPDVSQLAARMTRVTQDLLWVRQAIAGYERGIQDPWNANRPDYRHRYREEIRTLRVREAQLQQALDVINQAMRGR